MIDFFIFFFIISPKKINYLIKAFSYWIAAIAIPISNPCSAKPSNGVNQKNIKPIGIIIRTIIGKQSKIIPNVIKVLFALLAGKLFTSPILFDLAPMIIDKIDKAKQQGLRI